MAFIIRIYHDARPSVCQILRQMFSSIAMSILVKIKIFKAMVKPIAFYVSETWALTERDMNRLGT